MPLIGLASAGAWNEAVTTPARHMPIPRGIAGKDAFAVEIKGDSMNQLLPEGGWAVVDPDQRHLYHGRVYLIEMKIAKRRSSATAATRPVSNRYQTTSYTSRSSRRQAISSDRAIVSYGNTAGLYGHRVRRPADGNLTASASVSMRWSGTSGPRMGVFGRTPRKRCAPSVLCCWS
ncbi:S24 family peptidase [Sphingomonas sp. MMS24-JH45]